MSPFVNQSVNLSVSLLVSQPEGSKSIKAISEFQKPSLLKRAKKRPSAKPRISYENEFHLHDNKNSFTQERFCTWLHFKTEACGILEMAYCESMNP